MAKKITQETAIYANTLILGVHTPQNQIKNAEAYFEEFISLVKTLEVPYEHQMFIKLRSIDKAHFITSGKLEEVRKYCDEHKIEDVLCSEILTPLQERNLADLLSARVYDRTQIILDIFKKAATTAEGKIQVDIAELQYLKSRLAGRGLAMAQQAGFVGGRGPGETAKEMLKRYYADKIAQAQKRLEALKKSRDVQRKQRLESKIPLVSLVGYTNAGKSSLMNRLAKSDQLVEDKLFATVDTTTRNLYLGPSKKVLLSDTVGFISQLPPQLIEAFKATLDELNYASLLLLVVDGSDPLWRNHIHIVTNIINEIGSKAPLLYVFNKIDKVKDLQTLKKETFAYTPKVYTSTLTKVGAEELLTFLEDCFFSKESA